MATKRIVLFLLVFKRSVEQTRKTARGLKSRIPPSLISSRFSHFISRKSFALTEP